MRILAVTPGFYGPAGDVRIPALVSTFDVLRRQHELSVFAVSPEFGQRPNWVQPWRLDRATMSVDVAWFLWPQRTARAAIATKAAQPKLPTIVSVMGAEGTNTEGRDRRRVATLFRLADHITVGSGWLSERLKSTWPQYGPKFVTAPLLVPPPLPAHRRAAGEDVLRLVAVSSLQPVKQPGFLLQIAAALRKSASIRLDVFGWSEPTAERAWLQQRQNLGLDDVVFHHGFVPAATVTEAMANADVFLHPSEHEAQGVALIEAAGRGLPIVCRDVGVAGTLKAGGATLQWLGSDDPSEWAQAVLQNRQRGSMVYGSVTSVWSELLEAISARS